MKFLFYDLTPTFTSQPNRVRNTISLLAKGGILIVDDYGHWKGCKKAVKEFFVDKKIFFSTNRLLRNNWC